MSRVVPGVRSRTQAAPSRRHLATPASRLLAVLGLAVLVTALAAPGCTRRRSTSPLAAIAAFGEGLSGFRTLLRSGPPTLVVAGPRDPAADHSPEASAAAAEAFALLLEEEGFDDLVGGEDDDSAARPVEVTRVVTAGTAEEIARAAEAADARVIVYLTARSIELVESGPRLLEWTYDGSVEIVTTAAGDGTDGSGSDSDGTLAWDVEGETHTEAPNSIPADPEAAVAPLAAKWARRTLGVGSLALAVFNTDD